MPRGPRSPEINLMKRALRGEEGATRQYCGNYYLIQRNNDTKLYRCRGNRPKGFTSIGIWDGENVFDDEGYLRNQFWMLPRIIDGKEV